MKQGISSTKEALTIIKKLQFICREQRNKIDLLQKEISQLKSSKPKSSPLEAFFNQIK